MGLSINKYHYPYGTLQRLRAAALKVEKSKYELKCVMSDCGECFYCREKADSKSDQFIWHSDCDGGYVSKKSKQYKKYEKYDYGDLDELKKEIEDLKDLLEIEKSINLHKYPKIDLKEGDYFTVTAKKGSYDESKIFCFIEEKKINPNTNLITASQVKRVLELEKVKLVPDSFWNEHDGPVEFLTNKYNFHKYD